MSPAPIDVQDICTEQAHRVGDWLAQASRLWARGNQCDALHAIKEARDGMSDMVELVARKLHRAEARES